MSVCLHHQAAHPEDTDWHLLCSLTEQNLADAFRVNDVEVDGLQIQVRVVQVVIVVVPDVLSGVDLDVHHGLYLGVVFRFVHRVTWRGLQKEVPRSEPSG